MDDSDLMRLALGLTRSQADKMTHALGWPHPSRYGLPGHRRVKWDRPFRNYYSTCIVRGDSDWDRLLALGLAKRIGNPPYTDHLTFWAVAHLGKAVLRLRLQAARLAREVPSG